MTDAAMTPEQKDKRIAEIADEMSGWSPNDGMTPPEYSACETIQEWRAALLAMIGPDQ